MKGIIRTLIFTLLPLNIFANQNIFFEHITQSHGLPSNNVVDILQDSDGLIWFATYNGLASYDGYNFNIYNHEPDDSTTINHDIVMYITEETPRFLWVGTYKGFSLFDKEQNKFKRMDSPNLKNISSAGIRKIVFDKNGNLWLATNQGMVMYNMEKDSAKFFNSDPDDTTTICSDFILDLYFDKYDQLWIGTREGLDVYDTKTLKFKHLYDNQEFEKVIAYKGGILAITRFFNRYFTSSAKDINFEEYLFTENKPGFVFTDILTDYQGGEWYAIREYGLFKEVHETSEKYNYTYSKYQPYGINSNVPQCLFKDKDNNLWVGTYDGGVNLHSPYRKIFHNIKDNYLETGLMNNKVKTIYQDRNGDVWVGTKVDGMLSKFDRETQTFKHYKHNPNDPESLSDEYVFSITDAEPGYLWVGTMLGGLNHFNKRTGKCNIYKHDPKDPFSITSNNIRAMLVVGNELWISHHRLGLDKIDIRTKKKIKNYQTSDDSTSISSNDINVIFQDSKNNLWFTTIVGLSLYNKEEDNFKRFLFNEEDPNSISDNMVLSIHEDAEKNLWVGTKNGLNRFNHEKQNFEVYNTGNGLPSNSIYGLSSDKDGNLWISTNIGICMYNRKEMKSRLFTVEDGLQNNEFLPSVYETSKDGYIFFGGNEGFTYFKPEEISSNPKIPKIIFTDFKILNESINVDENNDVLKKHITSADNIWLNHTHSVFSIEFTALNYNSPSKNRYAYKMEGFDKDWQHVGTRRSATYTNLNPGDYVFKVIASNNDGVWNNEGISINIHIAPPWWKTIWSRLLFFVIIGSFVFAVFFIRTKTYNRQKVILESKVTERTLELNQVNIELTSQKEEILKQNVEIQKQKESLEKESKKIQILNKFGQRLTNILNIDAILNMIYDYVSSILETSIFGIGLYNEEKNALVFSSLIENGKNLNGFEKKLDDPTSCEAWCYNHQKHILMNDLHTEYSKYVSSININSKRTPGSLI